MKDDYILATVEGSADIALELVNDLDILIDNHNRKISEFGTACISVFPGHVDAQIIRARLEALVEVVARVTKTIAHEVGNVERLMADAIEEITDPTIKDKACAAYTAAWKKWT